MALEEDGEEYSDPHRGGSLLVDEEYRADATTGASVVPKTVADTLRRSARLEERPGEVREGWGVGQLSNKVRDPSSRSLESPG